MKDEIKEILQKIKNVANRETASRNALMEMKDKDYQYLLDYITNLQEENDDLKNRLENAVADCNLRIQENTEWKLENERLSNIIKEALNYIDDNTYYKDHKGHINIDDLYIILQGEDNE